MPQEGPALCGFKVGGHFHGGCLTDDPSVRLHSCELGTECDTMEQSNVVYITPVINQGTGGRSVDELGAGGGFGDLAQLHKLDLSIADSAIQLMNLCSEGIDNQLDRFLTMNLITKAMTTSDKTLLINCADLPNNLNGVSLQDIVGFLQRTAECKNESQSQRQEFRKLKPNPTSDRPTRILSSKSKLS